MMDILFLAIAVGFLLGSWGLVKLAGRGKGMSL
jgi:hypothetical protein